MGNGKASLKDDNTFSCSLNEPSGISSLYCSKANDVKVYIADCNNHCIRKILYDTGDIETLEIKNIPTMEDETDDTEGTTNKSGANDLDGMTLECDGKQCYPKFF